MNLLLLHTADLKAPGKASIYQDDRRFKHLATILKANEGKQLKVGLLNGQVGTGEITASTADRFDLDFNLTNNPPPPLQAKLIIALPRPKVVLRVLQSATMLGVKDIFLINAFKVEKSFWSCEQLSNKSIEKSLLLGLEQARDTVMPKVHLKRLFKPFVEDELREISKGSNCLVAHPSNDGTGVLHSGFRLNGPQTLVIGPEGGFIPYEIKMLNDHGFKSVSLGPRILKSETAMIALLSHVPNS